MNTNAQDTKGPLGIIAGQGELPVQIAIEASAAGREIYVLQLAGFEEPRLDAYPGVTVGIGETGKQIKRLKEAGCKDVVFAGIVKRPDFSKLKLDIRGARLLPKVIAAARKGDDALLRVMVDMLEREGFTVIGAEETHTGLKAALGPIAGRVPTEDEMSDLRHAARIAASIGALDIGQGCVVNDGLVLAVEAQEGTDAMLQRVEGLPQEIRGGVLVKRPKPIQERRIDMPTIGVRTIERAFAAGLAGIGIEADGALILDLSAVKALAEQHGLFIYGFPRDWD